MKFEAFFLVFYRRQIFLLLCQLKRENKTTVYQENIARYLFSSDAFF